MELIFFAAGFFLGAVIVFFILNIKLTTKSANLNALERQSKGVNLELSNIKIQLENKRDDITKLNKEIAISDANLDTASKNLSNQKEINILAQRDIQSQREKITAMVKEVAELTAYKKSLEEKLEVQKADIDKTREKFQTEFKNIANQIFEEKSITLTKINKTSIESILNPLGERLESFKKKVEETYDKESKQRFSLEEKVKELVHLNQKISQEANELTNALKGEAKRLGNWGEMILEGILEKSGLVKGREYFVQKTLKDPDGNMFKPDIIIAYPDNRKIIIDSKVSLAAYQKFSNSHNKEEQKKFLITHIKSIKNHINELSNKNYPDLVSTLDFTLMFIPIEPAFLFALEQDQELWNYAYSKKILLISPTNLIAALKMITELWKREYQNKNSMKIADQGAKLYEKFVNFLENLHDIGKSLDRTKNSYNDAMKQLKEGKGNLIGQAQKLVDLKIKTKKTIPSTLLYDSDCENPENK